MGMRTKQDGKIDKTVYLAIILFASICEGVSVAVIGWNPEFLVGIVIGTAAVLINFRILGNVATSYFANRLNKAAALYVLSLAIYFAAGIVCYRISTLSITAFGIGVIGVLAGAAVIAWKERRE